MFTPKNRREIKKHLQILDGVSQPHGELEGIVHTVSKLYINKRRQSLKKAFHTNVNSPEPAKKNSKSPQRDSQYNELAGSKHLSDPADNDAFWS